MNDFIRYLLLSAACITALYLAYQLFLRRDTFFMMNRVYLISAAVLSLIMPLFPFRFSFGGTLDPVIVLLEPVLITPGSISAATQGHLEWFGILTVIYFTGTTIFGLRFLVQLVQLFLLVRRNGITHRDGLNLVLVDRGYSPFSFFHFIFIKKDQLGNDRLSAVIEHEKVHMRQLHSVDLVATELLTIIQWFNPFAWLLQRSVKAVHEYLADEGVLRKGVSGSDYSRLIFDQTLGIQVNNLTNNFNVSLIKKRIAMITKSRSAKMARLKALFALPVLLPVIFLFSSGPDNPAFPQDNQTAQKSEVKYTPVPGSDKEGDVCTKVANMPEYPGGMDALVAFLVKNIQYPEKAKKDTVTGVVYVNFIVETDGAISHVKVTRGIGSGCDEEAVRVVSMMPKWKPGSEKDGKPVRVAFALPIKFSLDGKKK
jgi:TonB family protein